MQRRKTLLNALTNAKMFKSKEEGKEILEKLGLEENIRAEKLSLEKFAELVNLIKEKQLEFNYKSNKLKIFIKLANRKS